MKCPGCREDLEPIPDVGWLCPNQHRVGVRGDMPDDPGPVVARILIDVHETGYVHTWSPLSADQTLDVLRRGADTALTLKGIVDHSRVKAKTAWAN